MSYSSPELGWRAQFRGCAHLLLTSKGAPSQPVQSHNPGGPDYGSPGSNGLASSAPASARKSISGLTLTAKEPRAQSGRASCSTVALQQAGSRRPVIPQYAQRSGNRWSLSRQVSLICSCFWPGPRRRTVFGLPRPPRVYTSVGPVGQPSGACSGSV
jgi:hypothetical protein